MTKLDTAHPELQLWMKALWVDFPNVHISWAYRDAQMQETFFQMNKSRVHYPHSNHNKTDINGNPKSRAIDLFVINADKIALWPVPLFKKISDWSNDRKWKVIWSGTWPKNSQGDLDHFELDKSIAQ